MAENNEPTMTPVPAAPVESTAAPNAAQVVEVETASTPELVLIFGLLLVFIAGFVLLYQPLVAAMIHNIGFIFGMGKSAP